MALTPLPSKIRWDLNPQPSNRELQLDRFDFRSENFGQPHPRRQGSALIPAALLRCLRAPRERIVSCKNAKKLDRLSYNPNTVRCRFVEECQKAGPFFSLI